MELLFEIGTEEIPPLYIRRALQGLESVRESLDTRGIQFASIRTFGTPRRLVLLIEGLAEKAKDSKQVIFGPPVTAAFDASGKPTQAALGFARSQNVDVTEVVRGKKGKGEYLCVEKVQKGGLTVDEFPLVLQFALQDFITFPKTMHWEKENRRFARPVRWLTLVIDGKLGTDSMGERFSWAGLDAGNTTRGHRFLGSQEIVVTSIDQYLEDLRRNFVIVDHEERKGLVQDKIARAAASVGGCIVKDDDLLERVTFTVEHPLAVVGSFSPKFLEMPREVVVTDLKEHQEFFSVCDAQGRLVPHFVAVANMDRDRAGKIRLGNERVLKARLDDAHFYWEQDIKDGLEAMAKRLSYVVWQERLGTLRDKTARMIDLALAIATTTGLGEAEKVKRAAYLSKADLTSLMVREKEFSSLQGLMGQEYAKARGEDEEVSRAIFEHYLPRFAGDVLPETPTGTVVAVADKIDSLVGCFGIGLVPTGSEDPYALRRQATGFLRILMEKAIHLSVSELVSISRKLYGDSLSIGEEELKESILTFLRQRLQTILVESGNRPDMVESVLDAGIDDPALVTARLEAVKEFEADRRFSILVTAFKRAYNITKGEVTGDVADCLFEDQAERDLYNSYQSILPQFNSLIHEKRFRDAMNLLLGLAVPIDVFFGKVMVMVDDENLKRNRLNLLGSITRRFLEIANFSRMESSP